jgi:hypothetical protein
VNDGTRTSLGDVIAAMLAARGLVPDDNTRVEVQYLAVAKVTVLDTNGVDSTYRYLNNVRDDKTILSELAGKALDDVERHADNG